MSNESTITQAEPQTFDISEIDAISAAFKRDGVVRIRGLFSAETLAEVRRELDRYLRDTVPGVPEADRVYESDGVAVRNLWRLEKHDEYFASLGHDPRLERLVAELVNGEPKLTGVETFNKPARIGSAVPPHQDNAYFCQSPPDMLTVWIGLDAAIVENGAVYFVPGTQGGLLPHAPSGVQGNSIGLEEPLPDPHELCGTLNPGDALIHHCQIVHRSAPNTSDRSRCGLLMVFRGRHTQTDPSLQRDYDAARAKLLVG